MAESIGREEMATRNREPNEESAASANWPRIADEPDAQVRTFLIADIRGYTDFTIERGDEAAGKLSGAFARIAKETAQEFDGRLVETRGDEVMSVFASARQSLRAAIELQRRCSEHEREAGVALPVGVGVDAGEAVPVEGGYRGAALNLAARLCSLARAGEVLVSDTVVNLARRVEGIDYAERGPTRIKGFSEPIKVFAVVVADERSTGNPVAGDEVQRVPVGGFLGARPEGGLVARDIELKRVLASADSVPEEGGRTLFVAGEPGVGKTRLAQEVWAELIERGFIVVTGRCYESQEAVPYYSFTEALRTAYLSAPSTLRNQVQQRWPYLGRLVPEAGTAPAATTFGSYEDQQRLFWAITSFLEELAKVSPVAIFLDDVHWADSSTLELLQHLAENTRTSRVFLLAMYRDVEVGRHHPLERTLLDLTRERLVERVSLRRLDARGTSELVQARAGETVAAALAQAVYERTDGNAFFVEEVVRALLEQGGLLGTGQDFDADALGIPESVRAVIGQRLSRLSEPAQELLREASVFGQTFNFDELAAMGDRRESEVDTALGEAIQADLVREMGDDQYTFSHALAQQTLYMEMTGRRRRQLHRQAGQALEALPERVRRKRAAELTHHLLEAHEEERALPYALLVGDHAAEAYAHEDAYKYYRLALELAQELEAAELEAEIAEKLGSLLTVMIRYPEAMPMLKQAVDAYARAGDHLSEARTAAQIGRVYLSINQFEEGIEVILSVLNKIGRTGTPEELGGLHSSLAKLLVAAEQPEDALEDAIKAVSMARQSNDGGVQAEAEVTMGAALVALSRVQEGVKALRDAIETANSARDLFSVCRALILLSSIELEWGDLKSSRADLEQASQIAEQMDNRRQLGTTIGGLGILSFAEGEPEKSAREAQKGAAILASLRESWQAKYHLLWQAGVELAVGNFAAAKALLEQFTSSTKGTRVRGEIAAELELRAGRPAEALSILEVESPTSRLWEAQLNNQMRSTLRRSALAAEALLALGRMKESEEIVQKALSDAESQKMRLVSVDLFRVLGAARSALGKHDDSIQAFEQGLKLARDIGYPYGEARLLLEYARALPEDPSAGKRLGEAREIFLRLHADYWAEQCEAKLTTTG